MASNIQYRLPYTSRDFQSLMASIRASIPNNVPEWNDLLQSNYGIFILSTVAALMDWMCFYLDRQAAESYINTCLGKSSIADILQLLNYQLRNAIPAFTTLRISIPSPTTFTVLIPIYSEFSDLSGSNRFVTVQGASIAPGDLFVDVPARQGSWQTENFTSDGTPQQRVILSRNDIAEGFIRVWVGQNEWTKTPNNTFVDTLPSDLIFKVINSSIQSSGPQPAVSPEIVVTSIEFGDGFEGLIPVTGQPIMIQYLVTLGDTVKIPAGSVKSVVTPIFDSDSNPVDVSVVNLDYAAGGDQSESLYDARKRYPARFRTMSRSVTLQDFKTYVSTFGGVLLSEVYDLSDNASSDLNLSPSTPIPIEQSIPFFQIYVYVVPRGGISSSALNAALQQYLMSICPVDRQVVVQAPVALSLNVNIKLGVLTSFDPGTVSIGVLTVIQAYFELTEDGAITIGGTFHSSSLIAVLLTLPGVAWLDLSVNLDNESPVTDITSAFDQIFSLGVMNLTLG